MKFIASFVVGIIAVILGIVVVVFAALSSWGGNDLQGTVALVAFIVVLLLVVRALINTHHNNIDFNNIADKDSIVLNQGLKNLENKKTRLQVGYGLGLGVLSFYLFITIYFMYFYGQWVSFAMFAPLYIVNVVGVIIVLRHIYREPELPIWMQSEDDSKKNKKDPVNIVNIIMLITVFCWIWVSGATAQYVNDLNYKEKMAAEEIQKNEQAANKLAYEQATAEALKEQQLAAEKRVQDEQQQRIANATVSEEWTTFNLPTLVPINFQYPTSWGELEQYSGVRYYKSTDEYYRYRFSGDNTPYFVITSNIKTGPDNSLEMINGFDVFNVGKSDYRVIFYMKQNEYPLLCNENYCDPGELKPDLEKMRESFKVN